MYREQGWLMQGWHQSYAASSASASAAGLPALGASAVLGPCLASTCLPPLSVRPEGAGGEAESHWGHSSSGGCTQAPLSGADSPRGLMSKAWAAGGCRLGVGPPVPLLDPATAGPSPSARPRSLDRPPPACGGGGGSMGLGVGSVQASSQRWGRGVPEGGGHLNAGLGLDREPPPGGFQGAGNRRGCNAPVLGEGQAGQAGLQRASVR